ncbi:MAG: helix-turn-helix domain-containing protein [Erysipelotrichaceae bacterium]|nr:helix-turn-helix domain-containing protein [Erysipelotrichaceae bacterium]
MESPVKLAYNTQEACECLGINRNLLDNYRKSGLIRGIKVGRMYIYSRSELDKFLDRNIGKEITKEGKVLVEWDEGNSR